MYFFKLFAMLAALALAWALPYNTEDLNTTGVVGLRLQGHPNITSWVLPHTIEELNTTGVSLTIKGHPKVPPEPPPEPPEIECKRADGWEYPPDCCKSDNPNVFQW